jgi:hypothetical protein
LGLSAKYFSSPTLHLKIGKSRLGLSLYFALWVVTVAALWLLHQRGYVYLALMLSVLATTVLLSFSRDSMEGLVLSWHEGSWTLERDGVWRSVALGPRCVSTSWVIYLPVIDLSIGRVEHLWFYTDSIPREHLRRLRVRLTLEK